MKIYWSPRTRAFSTIWAMEETGMPYERVELDTANNAHKTPEFLAINPMGKVPAMSDGDAAMSEGAAIIAYIAERYPDAKLAPEVGDHKRARYLQWLFFGPTCIEPAIMQVYLKFEVPSSTAAWGSTQQVFDVLEAAVEKGPYLLGDDFSAADIVIGSGINFAVRLFKLIPTRPAFDRYVDTLAARPAFQRAEKIAAG
jgi:glutathione S-transferase